MRSRWRSWLAAAVVAAGVFSNLASNGGGMIPLGPCDDDPVVVKLEGDAQTGAATSPLGQELVTRVQCTSRDFHIRIPVGGEAVEWSVLTGGGFVNGRPTWRGQTDFDSGRTNVLWQLGPAIGEQTVAAKVRGQTYTFRAAAGGATAGGTCVGGAGTDFGLNRTIVGDEVWPLAGSPYRGNRVFVQSTAKLSIAPGVVTCLEGLTVRSNASIVVDGQADAPVRMRPAAGSASWGVHLQGLDSADSGTTALSRMRFVYSQNLTQFENQGRPLLLEDSIFAVEALLSTSGICPSFVWSLGPAVASSAESAARRVVFDGYGGPAATCSTAGVQLRSDGVPTGGPMPFQARVLRSQGDAMRIASNAGVAFALSSCEVSGSARHGLVLDGTAAQAPASISACNLTGNGGYALLNKQGAAAVADARGNWWGDAAGAPTAGGNAVSAGVNAENASPAPIVVGY